MLRFAVSLHEIPFALLMQVYREGNEENGAVLAPFETPERQRQMAESDFYDYLRTFFTIPGACYAMWEENGVPVSALRLEPYEDGLLVEALETAPECRRKGYATLLLQSVQQHLGSHGPVRLYSHVHKNNRPSLSVHQHCGFQIVSDSASYIDGSVSANAYTLRYEKAFDKRGKP